MRSPRRQVPWQPLRRRLCAGLVLAAYLAAAVGLPLPVRAGRGALGQPCRGGTCGCSADERERGTCCCSAGRRPLSPPEAAPACPHCREAEQPRCCGGGHGEPESAPDRGASAEVRWTMSVSVLRCRGVTPLLDGDGPTQPPAPPLAWAPLLAPSDWLTCLDDEAFLVCCPPPLPPPRRPAC